jgi:hypothetical protein
MKVDVLQAIRRSLSDALKNGKTLAQFKDDLVPTLQKKGWMGNGHIVNKDTGEVLGKRLNMRHLDTFCPPNGYNCCCRVRTRTAKEIGQDDPDAPLAMIAWKRYSSRWAERGKRSQRLPTKTQCRVKQCCPTQGSAATQEKNG